MSLETRCVRIRIKNESLGAVREWQAFINDHKAEVHQSLQNEGVILESVFLDCIGDDHYLIYVMACPDFETARATAYLSENIIDVMHRKFKDEHWGEATLLEPLIDFHGPASE